MSATIEPQQQGETPDAPPPLLSSWRNLYVLLLIELGALVAIFYALTLWASGTT